MEMAEHGDRWDLRNKAQHGAKSYSLIFFLFSADRSTPLNCWIVHDLLLCGEKTILPLALYIQSAECAGICLCYGINGSLDESDIKMHGDHKILGEYFKFNGL